MKIQSNKKIKGLVALSLSLPIVMMIEEPIEVYASGQKWDYSYTGGYQVFTAPYTGKYQLETWGAQGGGNYNGTYQGRSWNQSGGKGGYSKGDISLSIGEKLYVYVGEQGKTSVNNTSFGYANGGWNGGGYGGSSGGNTSSLQMSGGGGGATDIRLKEQLNPSEFTSLQSRVIVAGGGGGSAMWGDGTSDHDSGRGGAGGGMNGEEYNRLITSIATQQNGFSLGVGQSINSTDAGGGGGGYYGGFASTQSSLSGGWNGGGGGGSGYIGKVENGESIPGSMSFASPNGVTQVGHAGNGYARITALNSPAVATITSPAQNVIFDSQDSFSLKGTIHDPDSKGGSMKIEYAIDNGTRKAGITLPSTATATAFSIPITLPDLSIGNHTLRVFSIDNEGVEEEKTITFRIRDNVAPTINVTGNPTTLVEGSATLQVTASDNSGSTRIKLPDGNWIVGSNASFVVSKNGNYTFIAEDGEGNQTTKTVFVDKIIRDYKSIVFDYSGTMKTWTVPYTGEYKLETWGAQGQGSGGKGGKSEAIFSLTKGEILYVRVGGTNGFNGGGLGQHAGGGATDIRLRTDAISSRLLMGAGGGGKTGGTDGGLSDGIGGANVGNGAGSNGQDGGGGGSSNDYSYSTGYWQNGGYWTSVWVPPYSGCSWWSWDSSVQDYVCLNVVTGGGYYRDEWVSNSYWVNTGTATTAGNPGNGGTSTISTIGINPRYSHGSREGNGLASITPMNTAPVVTVHSPSFDNQFEAGGSFTLEGTIQDSDASGTMTVKYSIDDGQAITLDTMVNLDIPQAFEKVIPLPSAMSVGNHTLRVWGEDSGNLQSEILTIPFSIRDNIAPSISVTGNLTDWSNGDVTLVVKGTDNESGVKRIQLPDGTWVNGSTYNFVARENGSYTFVVEDGGGNQSSQTVVVSKIDKSKPNAPTMSSIDSWSSTNVIVSVDSNGDTGGSGVQLVEYMLQGATSKTWSAYSNPINVSAEGTTTISTRVLDRAGNISNESTKVVRIDKSSPELIGTLSTNDWTNQNVSIALVGSDGLSGVKSIELPNGNVVNSNTTSYTVSQNGTYTFKVEDNAGNISTKSITVSNIDKDNPTATHSVEHVDANTYKITIHGEDDLSGLKHIKLPNGQYQSGATATFIGLKGGMYSFEVEDNAGNSFIHEIVLDVPELNVYQIEDYVKAEWDINNENGMGYATKARLFRGDDKIYEGLLSDYEDKEAIDKAKPNAVDYVSVKAKNEKVIMNIQAPLDNGTSYDYTLKSVSDRGDLVASETKKATVTTGIDGYSYVVDTNSGTVPDDTIDTRTTEAEIPVTTNAKYYIHIKSIDKAGNVSEVRHLPFQDNIAPEVAISQNPTIWTSSSVLLTATASDSGLGVKRIQLPSGAWINGETASETVTINGTYTFVVEDLVGNKTTKSITVTNIDKTAPTAPTISNNTEWVKADALDVSIQSGNDSLSGVAYNEYRLSGATNAGWTRYNGAFQVSNEGETFIHARTLDKVGNASSESTSVVRIDRSPPRNTGITIKLKP